MNVKHVQCGAFVNESEQKALETIKSRLTGIQGSETWILLTNIMFSAHHGRTSDEIDMIAIGTTGVYVIEVKHWDLDYIKRNPDDVNAQAEIINSKAKRIKSQLKCFNNIGFIEGKILLTKGSYKAQPNKRPSCRGVSIYGLTEFSELLDLNCPPKFDENTVNAVCQKTALPLQKGGKGI